jgi:hypothetical protein
MVLLVSFVASFGASLRLIGTDRSNTALLCVFVMLPAAMVAIRLAMLLVMGTFENRAVNLWCGIGCGTAAGLVALSAVPMILKQTGTGVVAAVWMAAVPVTAAVATAFAVMDRQSRALPLVPGPWRALGFVPLIFLLAAIGWHSWAGTLGNSTGYPQLSDKKAPRTVNFTDVPGSLIFWTSKHETVRISKNCRSEYYTLTVRTPDLREQRNVPPGTETYDLAEGSYYVWLDADGVPGDVKGMEALPLVARRWYRNRPSTSAPTGEALCKVDFTFTPLE